MLFNDGFVFAQGLHKRDAGISIVGWDIAVAVAGAVGVAHVIHFFLICRHGERLPWVEEHAGGFVKVGQDGLPKNLSQHIIHGQSSFSFIYKGLVEDARALMPDFGDPPLVSAVPVHTHVGRVARGFVLILSGL